MEVTYIPERGVSLDNAGLIRGHELPPEVILLITLHARADSVSDLITLQAMSLVCKLFNAVLSECRDAIIRHYTVTIELYGIVCTRLFGQYHSIDDKPSVVDNRNKNRPPSLYWHCHGNLHRGDDKPASISSDRQIGDAYRWYWHDLLHREGDQPASIWADGTRYYYRMGVLHREHGPAIIRHDGTQVYYVDGKYIC